MVARGDLGLAIGYVRLPEVQERLVAAARRAGKPAVVATQVLEVFAATGLPQRAELSDLSLIARQRAAAVMLGKETVFSPHPIDCIRLAREVLSHETRRFQAQAQAAARPSLRVP
jgi:pyruvate kinase